MMGVYWQKRDYSQARETLLATLGPQEALVRDHPTVPDYQADLAKSHLTLGQLYSDVKEWTRAERALRTALDQQSRLVDAYSDRTDYRARLGKMHYAVGGLYQVAGRDREAQIAFQTGLSCFKRALGLDDGQSERPIGLDDGSSWTRLKEHAQIAAEVDDLAKFKGVPAEAVYNLARVFALAVTVVGNDTTLSERYASSAVAVLSQAIQKGFQDVLRLRKDVETGDLKALHSHGAFQRLLRDLEASAKPVTHD